MLTLTVRYAALAMLLVHPALLAYGSTLDLSRRQQAITYSQLPLSSAGSAPYINIVAAETDGVQGQVETRLDIRNCRTDKIGTGDTRLQYRELKNYDAANNALQCQTFLLQELPGSTGPVGTDYYAIKVADAKHFVGLNRISQSSVYVQNLDPYWQASQRWAFSCEMGYMSENGITYYAKKCLMYNSDGCLATRTKDASATSGEVGFYPCDKTKANQLWNLKLATVDQTTGVTMDWHE